MLPLSPVPIYCCIYRTSWVTVQLFCWSIWTQRRKRPEMLPFESRQEIDFSNATSSRAHLNPLTCGQAEVDRSGVVHHRSVHCVLQGIVYRQMFNIGFCSVLVQTRRTRVLPRTQCPFYSSGGFPAVPHFQQEQRQQQQQANSTHASLFLVIVMSMKGPRFIRNRWGRWCEFNKHHRERDVGM